MNSDELDEIKQKLIDIEQNQEVMLRKIDTAQEKILKSINSNSITNPAAILKCFVGLFVLFLIFSLGISLIQTIFSSF